MKFMKHTPLIEQHRIHGAKLVDFAGWEMPIQYASVIDEYQTVRSAAGLFDVSHMGRLTVSGQGSLAFLQRMTTNNVSALAPGQAQYSMVCNEKGGIKDDIFVYRTKDAEYLLCVNASNREKIFTWLSQHRTPDDRCVIEDRTAALAQIASGRIHAAIVASRPDQPTAAFAGTFLFFGLLVMAGCIPYAFARDRLD